MCHCPLCLGVGQCLGDERKKHCLAESTMYLSLRGNHSPPIIWQIRLHKVVRCISCLWRPKRCGSSRKTKKKAWSGDLVHRIAKINQLTTYHLMVYWNLWMHAFVYARKELISRTLWPNLLDIFYVKDRLGYQGFGFGFLLVYKKWPRWTRHLAPYQKSIGLYLIW